jgi:anti-anti-sigma factor
MRPPVNKTFVRFPHYSDEQLAALARRLPPDAELHLDLRGVDDLGSAAVATLLALNQRLTSAGKRLVLYNLAPDLYHLLDLTRLTAVLEARCQAAPGGTAVAG